MQSMDISVSDVTLNMMKKRVLFKKENGEQETPLDAYIRVAEFVAQGHEAYENSNEVNRFKEQAIEMMAMGRFMPNTPTLVNAGFKNAQCSACFVLPIDDNLPSIYKAHNDQGLIQASGGGTGFFLGDIRSAGTTAGEGRFVTRGPINWLKMLNENAVRVTQGMRSGANMAILDIGHPDVVDFIKCKSKGYRLDPKVMSEQLGISVEEAEIMKAIIGIEKFNISVSITDQFMQALENGDNWYFIDPHTQRKAGEMPSKKLWDLIVENAWENGEPGLYFEDTVHRYNMLPHIGRIRATNPCVVGDTLLQTDRGLERIATFVEEKREDAQVLGNNGKWRGVKEFYDNGVHPVWKVTTKSGFNVTATADHKFPVAGIEELVRLDRLQIGDKLYLQNHKNNNFIINKDNDNTLAYELLGWLIGDGYLSNENGRHKAGFIIGKNDKNLLDWFINSIESVVGVRCKPHERFEFNTIQLLSDKIWNWAVKDMGAHPVKSEYKRVPESVFIANKLEILAFLRGLFSADGHLRINDKHGHAVILTSKSKGLLEDAQVLISLFGIKSKIFDRSRPSRVNLFTHTTPEGEERIYGSDGELHELFLTCEAREFFKNHIGFTKDSYKLEKLANLQGENKSNFKPKHDRDEIVSIEYIGEERVYDITVDDPDNDLTMVNNGIITWDCGEQPRRPYESCNLGHINLSKYIAGTNGSSRINWDGFEEAIRFGVQFLDNVVEMNQFPIPELKIMNDNTRNIGLGVMGWADMLAMLHIPYDSKEAIDTANEVGGFFKEIAEDESAKLGKDRGNFPYFEGSRFQEDGIKYRRHNDLTTVAPTGQTSMYAGCSASIEPIIFPVIRREQAGMIQIDYHPALFNVLKSRGLDSEEIREKLGNLGSVRKADFLPEDIKSSFPSSHDVGFEWHVKHQIAWQKYISSGVSKTINFDKDASKDDIDKAYRMAYSGGCKGITVYRDGSRMYQPLSSMKKLNKGEEGLVQLSNKRDQVTIGTNRKVVNGCGNMMVYVGEGEDGKIQEVTARLGKGGGCASAQTEAIARMSSIAIQHGADPAYIAKQLGGIRCHLTAFHKSKHTGDQPRVITSCADSISVALSEHLANGTKKAKFVEQDNKAGACPECGGQLSFIEACAKCITCGFSRC